MKLFDRNAGYEAELYAEAQTLIDDGLDIEFVLSLYPGEAEWLAPMIAAAGAIIDATRADQPSYFFEASLKQKFLAAASRVSELPEAALAPSRAARPRGRSAGFVLAGAAAAVGAIAIGALVTNGSQDGGPVEVQIQAAGQHAQQIIELDDAVSQDDLDNLTEDFESVANIARNRQLDDGQKKKVGDAVTTAVQALQTVKQKNPELTPAVDEAITRVTAAGADAGVQPIITPTPTPAASATAEPSQTPATPAASPSPEPSPEATATPGETVSATPEATGTIGAETLVTPTPTQQAETTAAPSPAP